MKRVSSSIFIAALIFLAAVTGCVSRPAVPSSGNWFSSLPEGLDIYGKISTAEITGLINSFPIDGFPGDRMLSEFLEMTGSFYFAANTRFSEFAIVAEGHYPVVLLRSVINNDDSWRRAGRESSYWVHQDSRLELSFPANNVVFISTGLTDLMNVGGGSIAKGTLGLRRQTFSQPFYVDALLSDMIVHLSNPKKNFEGLLPIDQDKFPVEAAWFSTVNEGGRYRCSFAFVPKDPGKAQFLASFMKLMVAGWMRQEKIGDVTTLSKTVTLTIKNNVVRIRGIMLSDEDMEKLITLYSQPSSQHSDY